MIEAPFGVATISASPPQLRLFQQAGRPTAMVRVATASVVGLVALVVFARTTLASMDLGDTASFQAVANSWTLTPRQAYPLYYLLVKLFLLIPAGDVAHRANLMSAAFGAMAAGLVALVALDLSGSVAAAAVAGLGLAFSRTFWSQAVIAEVYTLNGALLAGCLLLLLRWQREKDIRVLAAFFALYAVSFGDHLSMITVFPAFTVFLVATGRRRVLAPRVIGLALFFATLGAAQYLWNIRPLTFDVSGNPPLGLETLRVFWNDVTKADWRDAMMFGVPETRLGARWALYVFYARQQFGPAGLWLAAAGAVWACLAAPSAFLLLALAYAGELTFAIPYNVGDPYVFFIPGHLIMAIAMGLGVPFAARAAARAAPAGRARSTARILMILGGCALPLAQLADNYPALDRSADLRFTRYFDRLMGDLRGNRAILAADLPWQLANGLNYYGKYNRPDLVAFRVADVADHLPQVLADNWRTGRATYAAEQSLPLIRKAMEPVGSWQPALDSQEPTLAAGGSTPGAGKDRSKKSSYSGLRAQDSAQSRPSALSPQFSVLGPDVAVRFERDPRVPVRTLPGVIRSAPPNGIVIITVLEAYREKPVDPEELRAGMRPLGLSGELPRLPYFVAIVDRTRGRRTIRETSEPFRLRETIDLSPIEVRIEASVPAETIHREGFGNVLVNHRNVQFLDRGVNVVILDRGGTLLEETTFFGVLSDVGRYRLLPANAPGH